MKKQFSLTRAAFSTCGGAKTNFLLSVFLAGLFLPAMAMASSWIWWEGEKPTSSNFPASTWLSPSTQAEHSALSGGNLLTAVSIKTYGPYWANYSITVTQQGTYRLFARKIWEYGAFKWQFDGGAYQYASYQLQLTDSADYEQYFPLNWVCLGTVTLSAGQHTFRVVLDATDWPNDPYYPSGADLAGLDAFVLTNDPYYVPRGKLQPGQKYGLVGTGQWNFEPGMDEFTSSAVLDLRSMNESFAGQSGYVGRAGDQSGKFVLGDGTPVRFWGANISSPGCDLLSLRTQARFLAKRGVNLIRYLGNLPANNPTNINAVDPAYVDNIQRVVAAFKQEGIYTEIGLFYPLNFTVRAGWGVPGYTNDVTYPTAVVMFDGTLKAAYKQWLSQLFTPTNSYTGIPLAQDPAVAVIEIQNEDSFFFWTFDPSSYPDAQRRNLEAKFGAWLIAKYGSIAAAQAGWQGVSLSTDAPASGRMGLASAWYMTADDSDAWFLAYTPRMADQIAFLASLQRGFYQEIGDYIRNTLGCRSLVESCNWTTADNRFLLDVERYTYTANDIIDSHPYFNSVHVNPTSPGTANYAVSVGDYYQSVAVVSNPRQLPSAYKQAAGYANIASESTWVNPNRFKAEGPLLIAAYNSLADVDGWIWFATGTLEYDDSENKFPLALPSLMGQFPGAALLYRRGDVQSILSVREECNLNRAYHKQMPLVSQYSGENPPYNPPYDPVTGTGRLDPLMMLTGRVECDFLTQDASNYVATNVLGQMNTTNQVVESLPLPGAAHGQLKLDGGNGLFQVNTPRSQGVCGFLNHLPSIDLDDVTIASSNQFGAVLVVSLDGLPLAQSQKILIQAMTEDNPYGWAEQDQVFTNNSVVYNGKKILSLGQPPMNVVNIAGAVTLKGMGQGRAFGVLVLDGNGYKSGDGASQVVGADLHVSLPANSLYTVLMTPPAIATQPQSQAVLSGSDVVFSVGAGGAQPLSYQWLFNNVPLAGATNAVLTMTNVSPGAGGNYSVVVTNWAGSVTSSVALLTVNVPAAITGQPHSQTVTVGNTATFGVTASGTSPLNYQWQHNGADLVDGSVITGSRSNLLAIADVVMTDAGSYTVVVTNAFGSVTSAVATLTILPATPVVNWSSPAPITYGAALGHLQLDATANVPGTFAYSPPAGSVLGAGTTPLLVLFTPNDTLDYNTTTASVNVVVLRAPLTVAAGSATRIYGDSNPSFTGSVVGLVNGDSISATYTCAATPTSLPGSYSIVPALVDPNNRQVNYNVTLVDGTLTVKPAAPPMLISVTPNVGLTNGGDTVSIVGTGFESGATVTFGTNTASTIEFVSATNLWAVTPPSATGTVDMVVTNTDRQVATLTNGFTYLAPLALQAATTSDGMATLSWSAVAGQTYQVQYKTDLGQPDWVSLLIITATNSSVSVSDDLTSAPQRFYRAIWLR